MTSPAPAASPLSPAELLAVARCFKDKQVDKARADLAENSSFSIDVTVRLTGAVQIGASTKATSGAHDEPATVDLKTFAMFCALLRQLKVRTSRIVEALAAVNLDAPQDDALTALFDAAQAQRAAALPPVRRSWSTNGRAAQITANITATRVSNHRS